MGPSSVTIRLLEVTGWGTVLVSPFRSFGSRTRTIQLGDGKGEELRLPVHPTTSVHPRLFNDPVPIPPLFPPHSLSFEPSTLDTFSHVYWGTTPHTLLAPSMDSGIRQVSHLLGRDYPYGRPKTVKSVKFTKIL